MENQTNKSVQPINHFHKNKYKERGNAETVVYQIACQLRST